MLWAAPFAIVLAVPLAGCGSSQKPEAATPKPPAASAPTGAAAECKALVELVNSGVQRVDSKLSATADPAEELRATAVAVDELVVQIGKLPLHEPQLKRLASDYQSMARALASGTRDLAGGVREGDRDLVARAQETIKAAVAQEDPIVDQINVFCTGSPGSEPAEPRRQPSQPDDTQRHET